MYNFRKIIKIIFSIPVVISILAFLVYVLIYFYYRLPIVCRDVSTLENMLRINFSDAEIVDIHSDFDEGGTDIVIYVKADTEYMKGDYFVRTNLSYKYDKNFEWLPTREIEMLGEISIEVSDIRQYGISFSEIRSSIYDVPYEIRWYEIDSESGNNTTLIFSTWIPRIVKIDKSIFS